MVYENDFFDVVYGISIFTHLSKEMHYKWFNELMRILKPGGMVILTLHGEAFKLQLSEEERKNLTKTSLSSNHTPKKDIAHMMPFIQLNLYTNLSENTN